MKALMIGLLLILFGCASGKSLNSTQNPIQVMGRYSVTEQGEWRFGYPGVTFSFNLNARGLALKMRSSRGQSWVGVKVDNNPMQRIQLSEHWQRYELLQTAQADVHKIELIHLTESWQGLVDLKEVELIDGHWLDGKLSSPKKLLFLGDSVTCGEAISRKSGEAKNSAWWDVTGSYAALIAQELNAQYHLVCWGGRGLIRSWDQKLGDPNLIDFFDYALDEKQNAILWDHGRYQPQLIFIAIGTNDFAPGIPAENIFVEAYVNLIKKLRHHHANAEIVITEGAILNGTEKITLTKYLEQVIRQSVDAKLHYVPSVHYSGDALDFHPNAAQHQKMAADFLPQLRQLLEAPG
jgi:hypothetical protein